ncbi:prolyl oligopeptidase family serine peptidase [Pedobacter sp. KR3-3]|uniref:Prolyl oligopeptidase family serine peptidase n=1 Tax=Pedobacter albus TaxID=3113905 RepID=A0ABU7I3N9_9SPHI|nr:prolyl oligopeptidase family serine peptidase [Pedobacter sp. KR3-3]MEE1944073.1 prolyl oligopeptidase family serine peptidase [Pedobacter sp. KR3-3]
MQKKLTLLFLLFASVAYAQKRPLDHSVYDTWENVGAKQLTKNGLWAAYSVNQQEGDANLYLQETVTAQKIKVPRASFAQFSADSKFAAFAIKPFFKDTRMAKIKKKKPDEMTKDTLGIANLTTLAVTKIPRVKSFKFPENGAPLLAYSLEKAPDTSKKAKPAPQGGEPNKNDQDYFFADDEPAGGAAKEGTDLIVKNLATGQERVYKFVSDYSFSKDGKLLVFACTGSKKEKDAPQGVFLLNTEKGILKTLVKGKGNFKGFTFDDDSEHLAFLGETSPEKAEIKDFNVYYNSLTLDTAQILVDEDMPGMPAKFAVSGDSRLNFSKDGNKLFFGIAPIKKPKDTTLVDFENAKLDIWGYKDDYLQPMQLKNLDRDLKKNYLTVIDIYSADAKIVPLTDVKLPDASLVKEGDANFVLASTDYGNRIASQWTGGSQRDYYLVDTKTGARKKILEGLNGIAAPSPGGNYILYFDKKTALWNSYQIATGKTVALNAGMTVKFYDEDNDVPDLPNSYGSAGWLEEDKLVYLYDRYDIWAFSPDGKTAPKNITNGFGRQNNITFRAERVDPEARFFTKKDVLWLDAFNNTNKENGFYRKAISNDKAPELVIMAPAKYSNLTKAKDAEVYIFDKGSYVNSPDVYISKDQLKTATKLSNTNPQQASYNWGTAELVKWTTPKGYKSEGILYKPENFDPNKKYPMIVYFYEKLSDGLYSYNAPSPTPSRLNIPFFVSNGYLVFAPDISYETGHPGKSAEEFINSGVESLKKNAWVDGTKIGIQGQSWGGYQVAHLITATNMYAAAWAGAPVVNMTSAYGGIRWESGMNRQFQYEKTQSRIGATLWEKPELYIENSPLFNLPKVTTPVVIMSNDTDGAVPWYQGIEMFTGLKRLGKPAWLLNYNNEAHNLVQRQNRKDIQIREQQFFDYYLKGAKAPVWMVSGIPATEKGKTWGFELTDEKP